MKVGWPCAPERTAFVPMLVPAERRVVALGGDGLHVHLEAGRQTVWLFPINQSTILLPICLASPGGGICPMPAEKQWYINYDHN